LCSISQLTPSSIDGTYCTSSITNGHFNRLVFFSDKVCYLSKVGSFEKWQKRSVIKISNLMISGDTFCKHEDFPDFFVSQRKVDLLDEIEISSVFHTIIISE
jgi:hypothetical protein